MNKLVITLAEQCRGPEYFNGSGYDVGVVNVEKFAELLLEEFRNVLTEEYRKTPLECCGHFLRLDEAILEHFYGPTKDQQP